MNRPFLAAALLLLPDLGLAQALPTAPLAIRQQHVQRLLVELEQKFLKLKLSLSQTEPQRAERLQKALNSAKELLLEQRMAEVAQQLENAELDAAGENQKSLLADIHTLLDVLTADRSDLASIADSQDSLQKWQAQLRQLATAEQSLLRKTEQLTLQSPPSQFNDLAAKQSDLAQQAAESLSRRPQAARQSTDQVAAAQQSMQQASQSLSSQNPVTAKQQQTSAIQQLLNAIQEAEQLSRELSQQSQSETLARLADHFRQMLEFQRQLTTRTKAIDTKRSASNGQLSRADRLAIRAIGQSERGTQPPTGQELPALAYQAQQALDLLAGEPSELLKQLIQQLQADLIQAGNRLADDLDTGLPTTTLQHEVETTLEQLSQAIAQAQPTSPANQSSETASSAAAGQKKQALLPTTAELKLLRAGQLQINRRTVELDQRRQTNKTDSFEAEIETLAKRQAALAAVAEEITRRKSP